MTYFIEFLILLIVLTAVGWPLFRPIKESLSESEGSDKDEYHKLLYQKDASFQALKDLEFDYKTGKIDDDDYGRLKSELENEAVALLKGIDSFNQTEPSHKPEKKEKKASFCSNCGHKLSAKDKFCSECGNKTG